MINVKNLIVLLTTLCFSVLCRRIVEIPIWMTLAMLFLWLVFWKLKKCKWLVFPFLVILVLYLNRLLAFKTSNSFVSFDWEQSFLGYPGISASIDRYYNEGLIIPYSVRKIFYGQYLLILPWFNNFLKEISPSFWIRLLGFSGFYLFSLGLIDSIKKKQNYWVIGWFLLVIFTAALRVIGDSSMAAYIAIPSVIYLILFGIKSESFKSRTWIWFVLLLIDIFLK